MELISIEIYLRSTVFEISRKNAQRYDKVTFDHKFMLDICYDNYKKIRDQISSLKITRYKLREVNDTLANCRILTNI